MKRIFVSGALLACAMHAQAASVSDIWNKLWYTADQRGDALLKKGDAANAAKEYADPKRKAYAEFKAGDYDAAAKNLTNIDDVDANYNRGNALAYAGDLQGAIKAYDAALKNDPHNQDALHNRELVMKALSQKPPQEKKSSDDKSKNDKKDGEKKDGADGDGKDSSSSDQNKPGDKGDKAGQQQPNSSQSGKTGDQKNTEQNPSKQNPAGKPSDQQGQKDKSGAQGNTKPDAQQEQAKARDDADQARRDAAASLANAKPGSPANPATAGTTNDATDKPGAQSANTPASEKQLAQEQWLRGIPDDPGGLLRRKFLIEHMMRQQSKKP